MKSDRYTIYEINERGTIKTLFVEDHEDKDVYPLTNGMPSNVRVQYVFEEDLLDFLRRHEVRPMNVIKISKAALMKRLRE